MCQRRDVEQMGSSHLALEVPADHFTTSVDWTTEPRFKGRDGEVSRPHYRRTCQAEELACPMLENAISHNMKTYGMNVYNRLHM